MHEFTIRSVSVDIRFKISGRELFRPRASKDLRYIALTSPIRIFMPIIDIRQLKWVPQMAAIKWK